ncbi:MAG: glycosyltransferase family 39 protein [Caldilineaceae bacterium]|nr:glycosyltransferase family 39 protein [Caldilineaceae bacterium]
MKGIGTLLMVGVLLGAFAVRAYQLDGQSFWSDEGISLLRSQRPLSEMLATMPVEQMPGYFILLHGWLQVVNTNDFAVRYLSLWPSVLAVALLYRLAADLGNRRAGLFAATLLATSSFQVWYAQEARTYSWLVALGLFSSWYCWRLVRANHRSGLAYWRTVIIYGLSTAAIVYLHYYGALVPVAHAFFAFIWAPYRRQWQFLLHWIIGGIIGLLCFLPWLPRILTIVDFPGWRAPIDPWQIPWQVLTNYVVGTASTEPWQPWLPWLYVALLLLGVVGWWRVSGRAMLFVVACAVVPVGLTFAIALRTLDFHERYTIVAAAPLLLVAGAGLAIIPVPWAEPAGHRLHVPLRWTSQLIALGLMVLLLLGNRDSLIQLYTNEALHKPDFRETVRTIERLGQDGDIVILDGPDPNIVFLHYYSALYPIYDMRPFINAPREETYAALAEYTANAQRVWEVLLFHEPRGVQEWLARNGWSSPAQDHNGIRLTLYGMTDAELAQQPMDLPVGDTLRLTATAMPSAPLQAADLLAVSTHWQVLQPPPDYKFSLRLVNATGEIVSAQDYVPQNWFAPTSTWPVGSESVDRRGFLLPADIVPGHYQVTLRLYDPATGAVAETPMGQDIMLGTVEILVDDEG